MHEDGSCELKRVAHYYIPLKCCAGWCIACVRDIEKNTKGCIRIKLKHIYNQKFIQFLVSNIYELFFFSFIPSHCSSSLYFTAFAIGLLDKEHLRRSGVLEARQIWFYLTKDLMFQERPN
jgi:hypothetical protein